VISLVYIMSKKWCEANQADAGGPPQGHRERRLVPANGTGPYRLRERQPNVRTVFVRNGATGARSRATRPRSSSPHRQRRHARGGAAVGRSGRDGARAGAGHRARQRQPNTRAVTGPELRTIFLGMDQKRDELLYSNVKGKNPFKDKRVRQAFYQAIDIDGIKKTVMRGASNPTALMVGPGINGFQPDNKRLPYDVEAAKKLLAEAGYPNGFEVTMNCPNDRYVNDGRICQAVAANLRASTSRSTCRPKPRAPISPRSCAATPASTCWAGRPPPTTRTTPSMR
jgi:peptide/nickel transport system substrate-binding protein